MHFTIEDNHIHDMPVEYHSAIGIFAGYIANSSISHNTMSKLSYDGIQFGWGWGQSTFAGHITVANNSIDGVLSYSADGGNIYSQSPMHNSTIEGNYCANDGNRYGMIYTDGASEIQLFHNVLNHGNAPCVFIHGGGHDPVGEHWYNDTHKPDLCCGSIPEGVDVATVLHDINGSQAWPAPAQAIINNAGRRKSDDPESSGNVTVFTGILTTAEPRQANSAAGLTMCPAAKALVFAAVPSATTAAALTPAANASICFVLGGAGCAVQRGAHGCLVEGACRGAPVWTISTPPVGGGVRIQTAGSNASSTPICLDLDPSNKNVQGFDCDRAADPHQSWSVSAMTKTIQQGGHSMGMCSPPPKPPPSPPPVPAPPVNWAACPQWHVGNETLGSVVYDSSGLLLQPDGTWHVFPDGGRWGHCTSRDLIHWNCKNHPTSTGFDQDTGGISVTPKGTFAMWPQMSGGGIEMAVATDATLNTWTKKGTIGHGGQRDPGRAIQLNSGWYLPEGVTGVHWFRDESNGSMSNLTHTGTLVADGTAGMTEFECPDVFELDGKMVVITSFSNRSKGVYTHHYQPVWVGEMSSDDRQFIRDQKTGPPDRLDYGAVGVSTMYAGKTGTEALPPFTRRVLMGFTGYGNHYLTNCLKWYSLPRDLSLSSTGKLLQHPVREAVMLRKKESIYPALALGSQIEVLVRCELPAAGVPKAGVLALRTLLAAGTDQMVTVGYNFSSMLGFADVPASLSNCGSTDTRWSVQCNGPTARTDIAPLPREFATASTLELRVFVDGHMLETFFGGHAVITTITGNTVSSSNITSSIVNSANLECNISSWTLALKSDDISSSATLLAPAFRHLRLPPAMRCSRF